MSTGDLIGTIFFGLLLLAVVGYCAFAVGYVRGWRGGLKEADDAEHEGRMRMEMRFDP